MPEHNHDICCMSTLEIIDELRYRFQEAGRIAGEKKNKTCVDNMKIIMNSMATVRYFWIANIKAHDAGDVFGLEKCSKCGGYMTFEGVHKTNGDNKNYIKWTCCGDRLQFISDNDPQLLLHKKLVKEGGD